MYTCDICGEMTEFVDITTIMGCEVCTECQEKIDKEGIVATIQLAILGNILALRKELKSFQEMEANMEVD